MQNAVFYSYDVLVVPNAESSVLWSYSKSYVVQSVILNLKLINNDLTI
jgi:hypothetical protein